MAGFGKASCAECRLLPPVAPPRRNRFPKEDELLKFHGFDSSFDRTLARFADCIVAEETPLEEHFEPALQQLRARRPLAEMLRLRIVLLKPLAAEAPGKGAQKQPAAAAGSAAATGSLSPEAAEALSRLPELIADVLSWQCRVQSDDVDCSIMENILQAGVKIRSPHESVHRVTDVLQSALADKKRHQDLNEAFAAIGCGEGPSTVMVQWPVSRIQEQIRLAAPQYELPLSFLSEELTSKLLDAQRCAAMALEEALESAGGDSMDALQSLEDLESLARYDGRLLPRGDPLRFQRPVDTPRHAAKDWDHLMDDAIEAQRCLKEMLAQGSTWARQVMNDQEHPAPWSDERQWQSTASDLAPNAIHRDPGLKDWHKAFEKAKKKQRRYEANPSMHEITDMSRLSISFAHLSDLYTGVKRLQDRMDLVWLDNHFRHPNVLGQRYILLGVRLQLPVRPGRERDTTIKRQHISEIRLEWAPLMDAQRQSEARLLDDLRLFLTNFRVLPQHFDQVLGALQAALPCSDGHVVLQAVEELSRAAEYYREKNKELNMMGQMLAEELLDELADQALLIGVAEDWVMQLLEVCPDLNSKRALRNRRVALVNEVAWLLTDNYSGVTFENMLSSLLDDVSVLGRDHMGRVCLHERWAEVEPFCQSFPKRWQDVKVGIGMGEGLREHCEEIVRQDAALCEEELDLLGEAKDLSLELVLLCARSSADLLVISLLQFLLARGSAEASSSMTSTSTSGLASAAQWAREANGISEETYCVVFEFLSWATFENQICQAFLNGTGPDFLKVFSEALKAGSLIRRSASAESSSSGQGGGGGGGSLSGGMPGDGSGSNSHESTGSSVLSRCVAAWQASGLPFACRLLKEHRQVALPMALALLTSGRPESRAAIAEALTDYDSIEPDWRMKVVQAGALPILQNMLAGGRSEGRCVYAALLALRSLSAEPSTRPLVCEAGAISPCAELALSSAHGQDVSYLALSILNFLASNSENDTEAIREHGLKVDSVGRVKKK